uniref:AlNc14C324G10621 protein n=1 Tax=Albugo laibachii Nc14 TaxID=890382 RepID=F0WWK9_9STRA|nr:AlNc14C324G10621 [Albugo laibachii Nc14]|eukprot:CCA25833.1 AlNc14C324G10621 [Albugo laibachii Nc14]
MYLCILVPFFATYLWNWTNNTHIDENTSLMESKAMLASLSADIITYRDLLHHFNVQHGRPPIDSIFDQLMAKLPDNVSATRPTISVLLSGPKSLEDTVQKAIVDRGSEQFRVFSEEFNL